MVVSVWARICLFRLTKQFGQKVPKCVLEAFLSLHWKMLKLVWKVASSMYFCFLFWATLPPQSCSVLFWHELFRLNSQNAWKLEQLKASEKDRTNLIEVLLILEIKFHQSFFSGKVQRNFWVVALKENGRQPEVRGSVKVRIFGEECRNRTRE